MKKRLMMVAVLVGALSLSACVDNVESDSVTAVRNAKVEQLKAAAALDTAKAEAELIRANAEKAYQEAQAEFLKAQAAVEKANAADKEFQLQKLKEQYERDLEAINLEAENRLLMAKITSSRQQQEFLSLANDLLKELYQYYAAEVGTLDVFKSDLNNQKLLLARYNAQSITEEEANAAQKAIYEAGIKSFTAQIEAYKAYEGKDKSELNTEVLKLQTIKDNALAVQYEAEVLKNNALNAFYEAKHVFSVNSEKATLKTVLAAKKLGELGYAFVYTSEALPLDKKESAFITYYKLNGETNLEDARQILAKQIRNIKSVLGTPKAGTTAATGLYATLEIQQDNKKQAETAKDQVMIDYWKLEIAKTTDHIADCDKNLKKLDQDTKDFEAAIASFSGNDKKAYDTAIEGLKKADATVAYLAAVDKFDLASEAFTKASNNWSVAINLWANYGVDAQAQIRDLESNIARHKVWIANLTNDYESLIQTANDNIDRLNTQIKLQEAVVELAKKNLDTAIEAQK